MIKTEDINWKEVESSQISAVAYEHKEAALFVKFKNGDIWQYTPFTFSEFGDLMTADSIGKHFHANIKKSKTSIKL